MLEVFGLNNLGLIVSLQDYGNVGFVKFGSKNTERLLLKGRVQMDISTLIGLIAVVLVLANAVAGNVASLYDGMSLLIVLVGGIGATLVAFPFRNVVGVFGILKKVFHVRGASFKDLIQDLIQKFVGFAETARREGILALEQDVREVDDPFAATGLRLAVDGTHPELIQAILATEVSFIEERHRQGQKLLKVLGINWAIFGGIGALIILIMQPEEANSGAVLISQMGLPLLYGLLLAGLSAVSLRRKLEIRSEEELMAKRMIMEGIMSIQSGDNPRIVEQKLNVFLAPNQRTGAKDQAKEKPAQPPAEAKSSQEALKEEIQPDPELQKQVSEMVRRLEAGLQDQVVLPGPPSLADLLPLVEEEARNEILEALGEGVPVPPDQFHTFEFEDLTRLTDREIQMILREVNTRDLAIALNGASREVMDRVFANVSRRVGTMIMEEMKRRKSVKLREVVDKHLRIIHIVQQLAKMGQVTIVRGKSSTD